MGATLTVDSRGFRAMCADLSRLSGAPMKKVVRFEGGKVLEGAMRGTKSMSVARINRIAQLHVNKLNNFAGGDRIGSQLVRGRYPRISVSPGKDRHWWLDRSATGKAPTFYIMKGGVPNRHWSDARWAAYQALEAERQALIAIAKGETIKIKRSRGVTKASWLRIADSLGLTLGGVPGYVRNAIPRNGPRIDGVGRETDTGTVFYIELENRNQILIFRLDGAAILQRAVTGRLKFFETNMRKGVFDTLKTAVAKYPGVFVS